MNIAVCDDDESFRSFLVEKLESYFKSNEMNCNIEHFKSGEDLVNCNVAQLDILFLDIQMADLDGIQTAHILRHKNPNFILVFVTSFIEYATKGYETKALRYILKEQIPILFDNLMRSILNELGYFRTEILFDFSYGPEKIIVENLIYLESKLHAVTFYLSGKSRHLYATLDSIQRILPEDEFVRVHKSYLVNINYIFDVKNYTVYLNNGICLPISQKKYSEIKRKFLLHKGKIWKG